MDTNNTNKSTPKKEFGLSSLAVNNRKTVFLILTILIIGGWGAYQSMPRESFPELQIPEIYVGTAYPGNAPEFIEDKITSALEKEINTIKNVDEISSTSIHGFSSIQVKFDFSVTPQEALRKVKDAVDKARGDKDFPQDLPADPTIQEMDFASMPILNVNLSGDFKVSELNGYAEILQDKFENLKEVSSVDIRGVQEQKVKVMIRKLDADAQQVSFSDIENALVSENMTLSGGDLDMDGFKRSVRVEGEFSDWRELKNVIVSREENSIVYLKDVADVSFGDADITSYARQFDNPVVMLDIKKRSGENLLDAIDNVKRILLETKGTVIPETVEITTSMDQSTQIRGQVSNLENSIIFGVILVVLVLLFFLGLRNALFVGVAIPLSMFMSFMLLNAAGVTLNIMVLFSLVLALGMLVDNGIVVVENIYRLMDEGMNGIEAAKKGVGEVALAIIASTSTTLAAFVPLAFWPGMMGEFMQYLPITLMIVLGSSLFVALVINPVLTALYMRIGEHEPRKRRILIFATVCFVLGLLILMSGGSTGWRNILFIAGGLSLINLFLLVPGTKKFQNKILPKMEAAYNGFLRFSLRKYNPIFILIGTILLLIFSVILVGVFPPKSSFFPDNEPNYINVFIEHPIGTSIEKTNETTKKVKEIVKGTLACYDHVYGVDKLPNLKGEGFYYDTIPFVQSIIEQVGEGTSDPMQGPSFGTTPHKARISVNFVESKHRDTAKTSNALIMIQDTLKNLLNADITIVVDKEAAGPPTKHPINIEVIGGDEYYDLVLNAEKIRQFLEQKGVEGVEKLRLDVELGKPELPIKVDREKARKFGLSTASIAMTLRTSLFGKDISTYKEGDDSYDITLQFAEAYRNDLDALLDQKVTFRNLRGKLIHIPIRSVIETPKRTTTYSSVQRLDMNKMVTVFSGISQGYNANEVVAELKMHLEDFTNSDEGVKMAEVGYSYKFTGQMEEQAEEMNFLVTALLIAVFLILLIIVSQFNSFSTPSIILFAVFLSLIGVFLGLVIVRDDFIIIMTMIGIISLAGIVVNNAIVLIDYTNLIRIRLKRDQNLGEEDQLRVEEVKDAVIQGGKTRLRPVLLTAITTILGLLPLAIGFNIDFITWISDDDPQIFWGGDNSIFFGPMSRTIIYGLTFATFLTLIFVPVMYYLLYRFKLYIYRVFKWKLRSKI